MNKRQLDWVNTIFIATSHLLAVFAVVYLAAIRFSWWTMGLGLLWSLLCGVSITGGYHRLFAHNAYRASWIVRAFYLFFGAGAIQNSALKWAADHRVHHRHTDQERDPYNIKRGFWWAHIGWVLFKNSEKVAPETTHDLQADALIRFQHRHYLALVVLSGFALPALLGSLWGDPIGAVLVAGFLRLVLLWQATFSINSVAHYIGTQKYTLANSARDSVLTALISLGEGYHNFHHRFQFDYRNGTRWYHFDPTKWWVWGLSKLRLTKDLKRAPRRAIERAKQAVEMARREGLPSRDLSQAF